MGEIIEILRLLLVAVLALAGVAKLLDIEGSRRAARSFGAPSWIGVVLPVVEIGISLALIPAATARAAAVVAAVLLAAFSVAIATALLRGRTPDCGCFGRLYSSHASWRTVARNAGLTLVALAVVSRPASVLTWVELAVAAAVLVVVGQAILAYVLMRRYGRALQRIDSLEARSEEQGTSHAPLAAGNGGARTALAGGAAAAVATTAAVAQAASRRPSALDPELQAIDAAFKAGLQRLAAASDRSSNAVHAYATTLRDPKQRATRQAAAIRAIAAERREVLALRRRIKGLPATGHSARLVRERLLKGLSLMAGSLRYLERALPAGSSKGASLSATSQRLRADSLVPIATAAQIVSNER